MKRSVLGLLSLAVCIGVVGCSSTPPVDSDKSVFDVLQEKVGEIGDKGGMASVGVGQSQKPDVALARAKLDARKNLAQLVQVKIENLEKAFVEEVGDASGSEMNEFFSSATKQITSQTLQGTRPKIQKYDSKNGVITAYVLMVLNPDIVDESLKNNSAKHLYERFRASKAFEELNQEIEEFEAAELSY
jgi:hypothetical protein